MLQQVNNVVSIIYKSGQYIVFDNQIHFSLSVSDDPPRPTFDSLLSRDMAGYMPARADFIEVNRTNWYCRLWPAKCPITDPH